MHPRFNVTKDHSYREPYAILKKLAVLAKESQIQTCYAERCSDCLNNGNAVDKWTHVLRAQKHGILSTYALKAHGRPYTGGVDKPSLSDTVISEEAWNRYEADMRDYTNASQQHSQLLINTFSGIIGSKIKGAVV